MLDVRIHNYQSPRTDLIVYGGHVDSCDLVWLEEFVENLTRNVTYTLLLSKKNLRM